MSEKPLCIDLFCGYGGWARGFLDAGYRVVGFDIEPKCAKRYPGEFVLADIRNLDGRRFGGARVIVASPPCTEFSYASNLRPLHGGPPRRPAEGMPLVREAFRVIREASPEWYAVENVRGAREAISQEFGTPRAIHGAWQLWGDFPGFIAPFMRKMGAAAYPSGVGTWTEEQFSRWRKRNPHPHQFRDPRSNAIIPYPLARALAEACLP